MQTWGPVIWLSSLRNWRQQPIPAIASYNAGPAAVASWGMDGLEEQPELWIEAIPYEETRLYVKTVLGSWWAYSCLHGTPCLESTQHAPDGGGAVRSPLGAAGPAVGRGR